MFSIFHSSTLLNMISSSNDLRLKKQFASLVYSSNFLFFEGNERFQILYYPSLLLMDNFAWVHKNISIFSYNNFFFITRNHFLNEKLFKEKHHKNKIFKMITYLHAPTKSNNSNTAVALSYYHIKKIIFSVISYYA